MFFLRLRKRASDVDSGNEASLGPVKRDEQDISGDDDEFDELGSEETLSISESNVAELTKVLPQSTDKTTKYLDSVLESLQPRWRNGVVRLIFTLFMITGFIIVVYMGPMALLILVLILQAMCYREIICVGYAVYRVNKFPWFRTLSWYFLIIANYFFYGESIINYFDILISKMPALKVLVAYHRFISFTLYIIGFIWFVLCLVKKYYVLQFNLFAWTHVALMAIVTQSYLILQNMFEGLIWFIVPVSMIICNDIFAYVCGFLFGKTPLIKLSPKKTWEGFIGGAIFTVLFGFIISNEFCKYNYFICPAEYSGPKIICTPSNLFVLQEFEVPTYFTWFGVPPSILAYPFVLHSFALSLFSSIVGPFGGFFASGFKRAFKVKDFGDIIPGHGGITDRFDCQLLMATFVNVYIHSFIKPANELSVLKQIFMMNNTLQLEIYRALNKTLHAKGLL